MATTAPRNEELRTTLSEVRKELLDFGLRNPLLNYRPLKSRGLTIAQVTPSEVYRSLVEDGQQLPFLPKETNTLFASSEAENAIIPRAALASRSMRKSQNRLDGLPTIHPAEEMDDRLLATHYAAKSSIDEQGVNTLYIALGFLSWAEPEAPGDFHRAPLILIPVELERESAAKGFTAKYNGDDVVPNVCLLEFMKQSYGVEIEPYDDSEDLNVDDYFRRVANAVSRQNGWSVDTGSIAVGFFSFAKFLMYRDLDPSTWDNQGALLQHDVLNRLIGHKYFSGDSSPYRDSDFVDDHLQKESIQMVVDADSTQSLALLDVASGANMVIQGPPGTGKSQTIVNLIAQAIASGKKVLFVSEKKAALDVVKQRLDRAGLGAACLELHSNKVKKKAVIEELKRTSGVRSNGLRNGAQQLAILQESKAKLDEYCDAVNSFPGNSQETVRDLYGTLIPLLDALKDVELPDLKLANCEAWAAPDLERKRRKVQQLQQCLSACGVPSEHLFWGTQLRVVLPTTTDGIRRTFAHAARCCQKLLEAVEGLVRLLHQDCPRNDAELTKDLSTVKQLVNAPELQGIDVRQDSWTLNKERIKRALDAGERLSAIRREWGSTIRTAAWAQDVKPLQAVLSELQNKWWRALSPRWRNAKRQVAELFDGELPKTPSGILAIPVAICMAAELSSELSQCEELLSGLFAVWWKGAASDWILLKRQSEWISSAHQGVSSGHLKDWCLSSECVNMGRAQMKEGLSACEHLLSERQRVFDQITEMLKLDLGSSGAIAEATKDLQLSDANGFWSEVAAHSVDLEQLVRYLQARDECISEGLDSVTHLADSWSLAPLHLIYLFDYVRVSQLLALAFGAHPVLAQFDSAGQYGWVETFKTSDALALQRSRALIAAQHSGSIPRSTSANGQLGVLLREFEKKARHLAVRQLMLRAGNAIQAMKPVFMMSPLSVANFLPPGTVEFDLVVFDEASQVKPSDALGAIVRGKQSVVVGDSKQLPPTSFFDTMVAGDDQADEDDETATSDIRKRSRLVLFSRRTSTDVALALSKSA